MFNNKQKSVDIEKRVNELYSMSPRDWPDELKKYIAVYLKNFKGTYTVNNPHDARDVVRAWVQN